MKQSADTVLMIEPANFYSNPETAGDNTFQNVEKIADVQSLALSEFTELRQALEQVGVKVIKFTDSVENKTPDSIYPNNWVSTHTESVLIIYPMKAENRRRERRKDIIAYLKDRYKRVIDLREYEKENLFLEGTGSLVLDRVNRYAYACISERTHAQMLAKWSEILDYEIIPFHAYSKSGEPIYHTNVMMNLTSNHAIVCLEAITDQAEKQKVKSSLIKNKKQLIEITQAQVNQFCGNVLEVSSEDGAGHLLVSQNALKNFLPAQREILTSDFDSIISANLCNIEKFGGGGARCMVLEVF